jgi:hypothetical protein
VKGYGILTSGLAQLPRRSLDATCVEEPSAAPDVPSLRYRVVSAISLVIVWRSSDKKTGVYDTVQAEATKKSVFFAVQHRASASFTPSCMSLACVDDGRVPTRLSRLRAETGASLTPGDVPCSAQYPDFPIVRARNITRAASAISGLCVSPVRQSVVIDESQFFSYSDAPFRHLCTAMENVVVVAGENSFPRKAGFSRCRLMFPGHTKAASHSPEQRSLPFPPPKSNA